MNITYDGHDLEDFLTITTECIKDLDKEVDTIKIALEDLDNKVHDTLQTINAQNIAIEKYIEKARIELISEMEDLIKENDDKFKDIQKELFISQNSLLEKIFKWFTGKRSSPIKTSVVDLTK